MTSSPCRGSSPARTVARTPIRSGSPGSRQHDDDDAQSVIEQPAADRRRDRRRSWSSCPRPASAPGRRAPRAITRKINDADDASGPVDEERLVPRIRDDGAQDRPDDPRDEVGDRGTRRRAPARGRASSRASWKASGSTVCGRTRVYSLRLRWRSVNTVRRLGPQHRNRRQRPRSVAAVQWES